MNENNESVLPCNPASPRRYQVPGPDSVKLTTEDFVEVCSQASTIVNAPGESNYELPLLKGNSILENVTTNKRFVQQVLDTSLFTRPKPTASSNIVELEKTTKEK